MKILFDINHLVDVNFFKNAMLILKNEGHSIQIIYRERGNLGRILKFELDMFTAIKVGEHKKKGFINKVVGQIVRDLKIVPYIKKNKIDLVVCFGATSALSAKYCGVPYIAFDDDFEYKIPFYHSNWLATRHVFPDFIEFSNNRTYKYHGFKELAYLHSKYLKISHEVLRQFSVLPNEYVFIREISNVSLNYQNSISILKELVNIIKKKGLRIILSLENKTLKDLYADDCIILDEPVSDIFSLLFYSLFAISSGDTVARETALLGVPTVYTGGRKMVVNEVLIQAGALYEFSKLSEIEKIIDDFTNDKKIQVKSNINYLIKEEWEDTTSIILKHINDFG